VVPSPRALEKGYITDKELCHLMTNMARSPLKKDNTWYDRQDLLSPHWDVQVRWSIHLLAPNMDI